MKSGYFGFVFIALWLLWFAAAGGWIANIYKIITLSFTVSEWGGMEVARVVGVFLVPLGAVLGYF